MATEVVMNSRESVITPKGESRADQVLLESHSPMGTTKVKVANNDAPAMGCHNDAIGAHITPQKCAGWMTHLNRMQRASFQEFDLF